MWHKIIPYMDRIDDLVKGKFSSPVTCEIDVSNRCQNNCSFCMYADFIKGNRCLIDPLVYQQTLEDLMELGTKAILFAGGGEPLTHPDFLDMAFKAKDEGFEIGLITNGILLNRIEGFYDIFKFIRVSLDAASPETYLKLKGTNHFYQVLKNIDNIKGTTLGLSFIECEENRHEIKFIKNISMGVDYVTIRPAFEDSCPRKDGRHKAETDLPCIIAGLIGIVGADNKAYYCCQHRGNPDFVVGDLTKERFAKVWKQRMDMNPTRMCSVCRYTGYSDEYEKYRDKKYSFLRHTNFL